jgi:hypothetical protein
MTLWTWAEIKAKVKNDLDLNDEDFIDATMLLAYANEAIDEAEQHVITINEDYLLQSASLALVNGTQEYSLPTNIYANKIRRIFYDNGSNKYEIRRIRDLSEIPNIESSEPYKYIPVVDSSGAYKIKLYPASRETSSSNVTIWFIGNANELALDADVMNIPEAVHFVMAHMKLRCAQKESHPGQIQAAQELERQRQLLVDTLTAMVPDDDNKVLIDQSFYDDFDGWCP